jgi:hypothetical protein
MDDYIEAFLPLPRLPIPPSSRSQLITFFLHEVIRTCDKAWTLAYRCEFALNPEVKVASNDLQNSQCVIPDNNTGALH